MEGALTMRKSVTVPVLLLSLLLTACGGGETGSGRNSFWDELGMDETETVLTVDGREVPAWRYGWWLAEGCREMAEACAAGGLAVDWDAALETETLGGYVQRQALENTVLYAVVENRAEACGVVLVTEPTGESIPADRGLPLADWQRQELETVGLLYGELCTLAAAEDRSLVTGEELDAFAEREGYLTVDRIVFLFGEDREKARQQAEEAFARLNNAGDQGAVFAALSAGDGSEAPETVQAEDRRLDPVIVSAAQALEPGQHSGILETGDSFCILRRMEPDRAALAPLWLEKSLLEACAAANIEKREAFERMTVEVISRTVSEKGAA